MNARTTLIYALLDPDTYEVRYIGKTVHPKNRARQHLMSAVNGTQTPVYDWWRSLMNAGKANPVMALLASATGDDWETLEIAMIDQYRSDGARLLNLAPGGNAPSLTPEQRAAIGRRTARKVHDDPERKRIWALKKEVGAYLAKLEREGRTERLQEYKAKLRLAAIRAPEVFGAWA